MLHQLVSRIMVHLYQIHNVYVYYPENDVINQFDDDWDVHAHLGPVLILYNFMLYYTSILIIMCRS